MLSVAFSNMSQQNVSMLQKERKKIFDKMCTWGLKTRQKPHVFYLLQYKCTCWRFYFGSV